MKRYILWSFVLLTIFFLHDSHVTAASLYGKVVEVHDGDAITVFNLNRPVRVKLMGVDAPEIGQAFGDVARKHLSDLIYDKFVLVEYSGLASNGSIFGRVLLDNADVGAQMIRDGAAWFDLNNQTPLNEGSRQVYQQSEIAARNERRGLWQAENPVAPWEFVKAEALRNNPSASLNAMLPSSRPRVKRPVPELTNLSLIASGIANNATRPASSRESGLDASWATGPVRRNWQQFRPTGENFSALVPEEGKQVKTPVPFGDSTIDVNYYMARDGWAVYAVMWTTGPSNGESDAAALEGTLLGFLKGVDAGYESRGGAGTFSCKINGESNISSRGYTGREFDMTACTIPAKSRAYTRVVGDQRQMYVAVVFYLQEDDNVFRFLKSFTVGPTTGQRRVARPRQ